MTKEETQKYIRELAQGAGVADDVREAFLKALEHDEFAKKLGEGVLRQSDYSRKMDELKTQESKLKEAGAREYYESTWLPEWQKLESQAKQTAQANQKYRELYGELDGTTNPNLIASPVNPDVITKKDFDARMATFERDALALIKTVPDIAVDHYQRFGERLDMNALEKFTIESKLPLTVAYEAFIKPRLSEKEKSEVDARVKAAREEGYKAGRAEGGLPIDTRPKDANRSHFVFDRPKDQPNDPKSVRESFRQAWETWQPPAGPPQS